MTGRFTEVSGSTRGLRPMEPPSPRTKLPETQSLANCEGILHRLKITWAGTDGKRHFPDDRTGRKRTGFRWSPAPVRATCRPRPEVQSLLRDPPGTESCSGRRQFLLIFFHQFHPRDAGSGPAAQQVMQRGLMWKG